jgi:hypothetical protein
MTTVSIHVCGFEIGVLRVPMTVHDAANSERNVCVYSSIVDVMGRCSIYTFTPARSKLVSHLLEMKTTLLRTEKEKTLGNGEKKKHFMKWFFCLQYKRACVWE